MLVLYQRLPPHPAQEYLRRPSPRGGRGTASALGVERVGMAVNWTKHILKTAALTLVLLSAHALENADVMKLVADLKSDNPKVRAQAITQLGPLYTEMHKAFFIVAMDRNPDVEAAYIVFEKKQIESFRTLVTPMTLNNEQR